MWMTSRDQCTLGTEDTFIGLLPLVILCCKDLVNTARNFRQLRFLFMVFSSHSSSYLQFILLPEDLLSNLVLIVGP